MQEAHNKSKASQPEYAVSITASAEMMNPIVLGHFKQMEILAFRPGKKKTEGSNKQIFTSELYSQNNTGH